MHMLQGAGSWACVAVALGDTALFSKVLMISQSAEQRAPINNHLVIDFLALSDAATGSVFSTQKEMKRTGEVAR